MLRSVGLATRGAALPSAIAQPTTAETIDAMPRPNGRDDEPLDFTVTRFAVPNAGHAGAGDDYPGYERDHAETLASRVAKRVPK
jgi:hypothetical protein